MRFQSIALCVLPALATAQQGVDYAGLTSLLPSSVVALLATGNPTAIANSIVSDVRAGTTPAWLESLPSQYKEAFGLPQATPTPSMDTRLAGTIASASSTGANVYASGISGVPNPSATESSAAAPGAVTGLGSLGGLVTVGVFGAAGLLGAALL